MSEVHLGGNIQNTITLEEHEGEVNGKRTLLVPLSYYRNASLASGYIYHGFANPGSNPTLNAFRVQREELNTGNFLFAGGNPYFRHTWSGSSLASVSYS
jgi:hypothetical protein